MSNETLGNVGGIRLENCMNCIQLPALGDLQSLQHLRLRTMNLVQYLDNESSNGSSRTRFARLESLVIDDLPNLERLLREEGKENFPCLSELDVIKCPKLVFSRGLESVKHLTVNRGSELLLNSISNLNGITRLHMCGDDNMTSFPEGMLKNLTSLLSLRIEYYTKLPELQADLLIELNALETLYISDFHELSCFPDGIFQSCRILKSLTIKSCKKLKSLPEGFGDLALLESLQLIDCPMLEGFPSCLSHLSSFKNLRMSGVSLNCGGGNLRASHKLAHFPESFRNLPSLESMTISYFLELASLPDWLGDLQTLRELRFAGCPDLAHIPASIKRLTNLQKLEIESCPKLEERCEKEVGEDWHKIAHIPNVYVGPHRMGSWMYYYREPMANINFGLSG